MEAIVCGGCDTVIAWVESEKSGTLYGTCKSCLENADRNHPAGADSREIAC